MRCDVLRIAMASLGIVVRSKAILMVGSFTSDNMS